MITINISGDIYVGASLAGDYEQEIEPETYPEQVEPQQSVGGISDESFKWYAEMGTPLPGVPAYGEPSVFVEISATNGSGKYCCAWIPTSELKAVIAYAEANFKENK